MLGRSFDFEKAGQFGDSFGPLSALMAALAAVGAWFALQQSREHAFEATFYSLLEHHNSIVAAAGFKSSKQTKNSDGKTIKEKGDTYEGREAYRRLLRSLRSTIASMKGEDDLEKVLKGYSRFFDRYEDKLAHYFRTLYHIVLYIHRSKVNDKQLYFRILRAQLSNSEQILLLYNAVAGKGFWKFKELVEIYSLLHNVRFKEVGSLWEASILKSHIGTKAFRENDAEKWPTAEDVRKAVKVEEKTGVSL
ncbi:MAG: putative phage abortive infection protein [Sphingomicrobium sp.]